jgi:hypothetical protein
LKTIPAALLMICLIAIVFISGCIMSGTSDNKPDTSPADNGSQVTASPAATSVPAPAIGNEPDPIIVSREGSDLVKIHLEKGLSVFTLNHRGSGNCQVWLSDKVKKLELLYDIDSGYWGSKAVTVAAEDDYYLEVCGDDLWTVQVTQPRYNYAQGVPVSLSGQGQQVSEFFSLDAGPATFRITHDGWLDFNVWLFRNDGAKLERVASTYGVYDESMTVNITRSGVFVLDVQADGNWKIDITR